MRQKIFELKQLKQKRPSLEYVSKQVVQGNVLRTLEDATDALDAKEKKPAEQLKNTRSRNRKCEKTVEICGDEKNDTQS